MKTDIEIEKTVNIQNINDIADKVGIKADEIIPCGEYKAKISLDIINNFPISVFIISSTSVYHIFAYLINIKSFICLIFPFVL